MLATWTPAHNIHLAREICGYEVQTSPRGVHYIIDGDNHVRPLPDFLTDHGETLTTLEAWLKLRPSCEARLTVETVESMCVLVDVEADMVVSMGIGQRLTTAIAAALYFTLPPEAPQ